jgi:hypothetical protein
MSEILVGKYLFERLKQLGVKSVFGVPGGESHPPIISVLFNTFETRSLLTSWQITNSCYLTSFQRRG